MTLATPVDTQLGQVLAVYEVQAGGTLAADLVAAATTIALVDPVDFHELGGDCYLASGDDAGITSQVITYTAADLTTGVLQLAAPWPADWPTFAAGDYVWCSPVATERRVDVALDGEADQLVTARVPFTTAAQVAVGVRPPDAGEWIRLGHSPLGYTVVDLEGEYPSTDPASVSIVDPDTGEVVGELGPDAAFDTVTADVITSPSVPFRNFDDLLLYVDASIGDDGNDGTAIAPLLDTFERTVANPGLGTADTGQPWTILTNTGNLLDVNAGAARFRTNAGSQTITTRSGFGALDVELLGQFNLDGVLPVGNAFAFGFTARMLDASNSYWIGFTVLATGSVRLDFNSKVGGAAANIGSLVLVGAQSAAALGAVDWMLRAQVQVNPDGGTDLRGKAWTVGSAEPDWQLVTVGDLASTLQVPGQVGLEFRSGSGVTQTSIFRCSMMTAACIDASGLLIDTTVGSVGPLLTVNEAISRAGDWNDGVVRVVLSGTIEETIVIRGLAGGGQLVIDGAGGATLWGTVTIQSVMQRLLSIRNMTIQDTGDGTQPGTVFVQASTYVECLGLNMQANGRAANIQAQDGSMGVVQGCNMGGATGRCVYVANASTWYLNTNKGAGPEAYRCSTAILIWIGSRPTGTLAAANNGQIFPASGGTTDAGSPPAANAKKTISYNADATHTWRPSWGWRDPSEDEVYQGEYGGSGGLSRGCAFFGTKLVRAGKTIDSGKVYVKRAGYGGASQGQAVWLCTYLPGSQPGGQPLIVNGPQNVGSLAWGAAKWFDIPKPWAADLLAGNAKAIGVYHGSASPYSIYVGRRALATSFSVKLTYH